ncbi:Fur family transcriptional regulator [Malonomonas rubra]|uniref:Fur family transcriptional regulator n=1 Tax=Malonomonas rubra TaxID=57040 RepID=UPI0026F074CC|nr:transcriptional repressor [Malonomonas rubra]
MPPTFQAVFNCVENDHQACIDRALQQAEHLCRQQNKRFTTIRRQVLELVWQQHKPIGAYDLLHLLQQQKHTAPPTVYRALDFLLELGLVHRIASLNAYVGCSYPNRTHDGQFLICESCHALAELDIPEITETINQSAAVSGFKPSRQTIEIMGVCSECRSTD